MKAIFILGGVASGKSTICNYLVNTFGLKGIAYYKNADDYLEELAQEYNIDAQRNPEEYEKLRIRGINLVRIYSDKALDEKKIVFFNMVSKKRNIRYAIKDLKKRGYDYQIIFVDSDLKTCLDRNKKRERVVPEEVTRDLWNRAQEYKKDLKEEFKDKFFELDNSLPITNNPQIMQMNDLVDRFLHPYFLTVNEVRDALDQMDKDL